MSKRADGASPLQGLRVTFLSLIPDTGHVVPLLRMADYLRRYGAAVQIICPDEAVHLAEQAHVQATGFGRVIPESQVRHIERLSRQSELGQRLVGVHAFHKHYISQLQENVFRRFPTVTQFIEDSTPELLIADDHLFERQYQWLANRCQVSLVLHYSAGTRYPSARREAWTWLHGPAERTTDFASRLYGKLACHARRLLYPAEHASDRRRQDYLSEQWRIFAETAPVSAVRIATGTGVLEDHFCTQALDQAVGAKTVALPPTPPLENSELEPELSTWLDAAGGPVLYVCFGTMVAPPVTLSHTIAETALRLGARVLWASRRPPLLATDDNHRFYADHFRWVPWAPQTRVLKHPAVRAFLTHAGAGAVQEAIWYGKPMICAPCQWDQFYNAWIVSQLGCGSTLRRRAPQPNIRDALTAALFETTWSTRITELSRILRALSDTTPLAQLVASVAGRSKVSEPNVSTLS